MENNSKLIINIKHQFINKLTKEIKIGEQIHMPTGVNMLKKWRYTNLLRPRVLEHRDH